MLYLLFFTKTKTITPNGQLLNTVSSKKKKVKADKIGDFFFQPKKKSCIKI